MTPHPRSCRCCCARVCLCAVQDGVVPWRAPGSGRMVALSNFVLPAFFDPQAAPGTRLDYLGVLKRPFTKTPGGYQISLIPQPDDSSDESKHAHHLEDHEGHALVLVGGGAPKPHKTTMVLAASFGPAVPDHVKARKLKTAFSRMARRTTASGAGADGARA